VSEEVLRRKKNLKLPSRKATKEGIGEAGGSSRKALLWQALGGAEFGGLGRVKRSPSKKIRVTKNNRRAR